MYVNCGMIAAAHTQGEVGGVMAHELSHVALRHGTAQATKATKYEIGTLLGAVVGSITVGVSKGTDLTRPQALTSQMRRWLRMGDDAVYLRIDVAPLTLETHSR